MPLGIHALSVRQGGIANVKLFTLIDVLANGRVFRVKLETRLALAFKAAEGVEAD